MGTWNINIKGHGCHHNGQPAIDADLATKAFVETLRKQGHGITRAEFELTGGICDNLLPNGQPIPEGPTPEVCGAGSIPDSDFGKRWKSGLGFGMDPTFFEAFQAMWQDGRKHPAPSHPTGLANQPIEKQLSDLTVVEFAGRLYSNYCEKVGGKAFNGDRLPTWETFRADPNKKLQSDAWVSVAWVAITSAACVASQQ